MQIHLDIEIDLTPADDETGEDLVAASEEINDQVGHMIERIKKNAAVTDTRPPDVSAAVRLSDSSRRAMQERAAE